MLHGKAQDLIIQRMDHELSPKLHYHSVAHTLEVMRMVEVIAEFEEVSAEDVQILKTAAAYHDSGFLRCYFDHEQESCMIVREILPEFGFDDRTITVIEELIMATRVPQVPKSELARILCDADLEYLGGPNYDEISSQLYSELNDNGFQLSDKKWLDTQIRFLTEHQYWTNFALSNRSPNKALVLNRLIASQAA